MPTKFKHDVEEFFCSEPLSILTKIIDKNYISSPDNITGYSVTLYNKCGNSIKGLPKKIDKDNSSVLLNCYEQKTYSIVPLTSISFIEIHNPHARLDIDDVSGFEHNYNEIQTDNSLDIESYLVDAEKYLKANNVSHIELTFKEVSNINNAIVKNRMRDLIDTITNFLISTNNEDTAGKKAISEIKEIKIIGKVNSMLHIRRKKELISIEYDFSNSLPIKLSTKVSDKFENIL